MLTAEKEEQVAEEVFADLLHEFHQKSDQLIYNKSDYWATPAEVLQNGMSGDCEDFATIARDKLLAEGVQSRVVEICNWCDGDAHLIVVTVWGWVLDNTLHTISIMDYLSYTIIKMSSFIGEVGWYLAQ